MPTYKNNHTDTAYLTNPTLRIASGASVQTSYYIKNLPAYLEKTAETPLVQPWDLLATVGSVPATAVDVHEWNNVVIYNATAEVTSIVANSDTANPMIIMEKSKEIYDNSTGLFGSLTVTAKPGTGSVYIWGVK